MAMESLEEAFVHELEDLYGAEKQIIRAMPKMIKATHDRRLRDAFEKHLRQTEEQARRVEQAFQAIGRKAKTRKCEGMVGILDEGATVMEENAEREVKDAMLISAAQKVEHYEIATYGTLCTWAEMLGFDEAAKLLKQNLGEEKQTDELLNEIAQQINSQALEPSEADLE